MTKQKIKLGSVLLKWSKWYRWNDLKKHNRKSEALIPNEASGVYEVKLKEAKKRLTIGKTTDLRRRVKEALVRGKAPHSAGKRIRAMENLQKVSVRWAVTSRPAAVEEELHRLYKNQFNELPKHTKHT